MSVQAKRLQEWGEGRSARFVRLLGASQRKIVDYTSAEHFVGSGAPDMPVWKRALDLSLVLLCAPVWIFVGLALALVIKLGSPGPVFFTQRRIGHRGADFTLFKFRTMKVNAETDSHRAHTRDLIESDKPMVKLDAKSDPRLIPFGGLIRASGLDELPQLLNVLRGEMSLVGPRPCIPYEYECYEPWQRRRLDAVPGLTGLWQVSGKNRTTFQQMVKLDIEYSERQSLLLDLSIMAKTFRALWTQWQDQKALAGGSPSASRGIDGAEVRCAASKSTAVS